MDSERWAKTITRDGPGWMLTACVLVGKARKPFLDQLREAASPTQAWQDTAS